MKPLRYYSEKKSIVSPAGQNLEFFDIAPIEGPNGGRFVADYYFIYVNYQVDVTVGTQDGRDMDRLIQRVQVIEDNGYNRVNLAGDELRAMNMKLLGSDRIPELADHVVAANTAGLHLAIVPMEKPKTVRPRDWSQPVDELRKIIVQAPTVATVTGGVATIAFDTYEVYIVTYGHEEMDLQFHCKDTLRSEEFTSTTQGKFTIDGKLHDFFIWTPGAGGGASQANFTDIRIDTANILETTKKTELLAEYRFRFAVASNLAATRGADVRADIFAQGKAVPVLCSDAETSCYDGPYIKQLKVDMTNTVASQRALLRIVQPADPAQRQKKAADWGATGAMTVKTLGKSQRNLGDWDEPEQAYLPLKAQMRRRR